MRSLKRFRIPLAAAAAAALAGVAAVPSGQATAAGTGNGTLPGDAPVEVVAEGLHSPRDLTWTPDGRLLVSEAGGIKQLCDSADIMTAKCFSTTGAITDITDGEPERVVEGLASNVNNAEVVGPNAMEYVNGRLHVLMAGHSIGMPDWLPRDLTRTLKRQYGRVLQIKGDRARPVANPGRAGFEWMTENPDLISEDPTSNPTSMAAKPGGGFYYVDAAANILGEIDRWGRVEVLKWIPKAPNGADSVPTCVDVGPDGGVYVGQLTGFGNTGKNAANVYRYDPETGELKVWESGFATISGCGFGANGDFYVTQFDTTGFPSPGDPQGVVTQIAKDGTRTELGLGKLFAPQGFLAGPDGSVYVTNNSVWYPVGTTNRWDQGEVVKIG
ncbi:ScyD/ScyE family protein [Streptomyces sp. MAR4 CNX-425]|uniref:ScyD/ScyE family protein n=1 Tax=Streptomyces sp. MAR4 CNX-425 TaxID=3406343 RepID=UPI003B501EF7